MIAVAFLSFLFGFYVGVRVHKRYRFELDKEKDKAYKLNGLKGEL